MMVSVGVIYEKFEVSDHRILSILKQNEDGVAVAGLAREQGISAALIYQSLQIGRMDAALKKRLKELEAETTSTLFIFYSEISIQLRIRFRTRENLYY